VAQVEAARGGPAQPGASSATAQLGAELDAYFAGRRRTFDVPLDLVGTAFQIDVWRALLAIAYGQTAAMPSRRGKSAAPRPRAPWPQPTARTRSRSSCRATA
jgi:methylated-DNA-[protein]-cysteine S-methyltransferase